MWIRQQVLPRNSFYCSSVEVRPPRVQELLPYRMTHADPSSDVSGGEPFDFRTEHNDFQYPGEHVGRWRAPHRLLQESGQLYGGERTRRCGATPSSVSRPFRTGPQGQATRLAFRTSQGGDGGPQLGSPPLSAMVLGLCQSDRERAPSHVHFWQTSSHSDGHRPRGDQGALGEGVTLFSAIGIRVQMTIAIIAPSKSVTRSVLTEFKRLIHKSAGTHAVL